MPVVIVPVSKGQRLSDVEQIYPLPTNGIFHKRLPGLGATHGEIIAPRHSIIILPNRPVIETKVAKYNAESPPENEILGIYQGITKEKIIEYLGNEVVIHKKILTTPEGYDPKFKEATAGIWDYIKKEYYLLIDECERAIQDIDYREKITAPFDDFFDFNNKGLISATTLPFSDPRFEQDFTHYVIGPDWDYCQPLTLLPTNNVVAALRDYFFTHIGDCYFIFLSSITTMTALIDALGTKADSKIHCSEKRVKELQLKGYKASSHLEKDKLAKYNFLTSRFYSAIDIELDYKPEVLMITEVIFAEHSILDPQTEVIQIVGRFRNGTSDITHITNFNPDIEYRTSEQARIYMDGQRDAFNQILKLKAETKSEGGIDLINRILTEPKFSKYFKPDGTYNWFMLDNYIQEQRVLGMYKSQANLIAAYSLVQTHFDVRVTTKLYPLDDTDRLKRETAESRKALVMEVIKQLQKLELRHDSFFIGERDEQISILREIAPVVVEAFEVIKLEGIIEADYSESKMKAAISKVLVHRQLTSPRVRKDVDDKFKAGDEPIEMYITTTLQDIYDRHSIKLTAYATHIKRYFEAERTTRQRSDQKVYKLNKRIDLDT